MNRRSLPRLGLRRLAAIALGLTIALMAAAPPLLAEAAGGWSPPAPIDHTTSLRLTSLSCTSSSFCIAVDDGGNALSYNGSSWTTPTSIEGAPGTPLHASRLRSSASPSRLSRGRARPLGGASGAPGLNSVSCTSTSFCMAVDMYGSALRFGGSSWTNTPQVDIGGLSAVSCFSSSFCMAMGWGEAVHYDGVSWTSPEVVGNAPIDSVSCPSRGFCMAVDEFQNALRYDGTSWTATVIGGAVGRLASVSCISSSFCMAVDGSGNALTYNGSSWAAPNQVDAAGGLASVSCASRSFCMALDYNGNAMTYNGSSWTAPDQVDAAGGLASVSCTSTSFCMAVDGNGNALSFNGSSWTAPGGIDSANPTRLRSVSCPSRSFCMALDDNGNALSFNGSSWTAPATVEADAGFGGQLSSVSCTDSSFCMAVDYRGNALSYNGLSWTSPTSIDGTGGFYSVSCTSSSFCMAVDYNGKALSYNGSSWTAPANVDAVGGLASVSCTSSSFCMAVDGLGNASHYNGLSWTAPANVDGTRGLVAVSCPSISFCMAVDYSGVALHYNGFSWSSPTLVDTTGGLASVSCTSSSFCMAVDYNGNTANALHYDGSSWTLPALVDSAGGLDSVSCVDSSFCMAVDSSGNALTYLANPGPAGSYAAFQPSRICDTRPVQAGVEVNQCNNGATRSAAPLGPSGTMTIDVCDGLGTNCALSAVAINVTVTGSTGSSYLTVYPTGVSRPTASNLNYTPGDTVANLVEVKVGANGTIALYNNAGSVDVIVDLEGTVAGGSSSSTGPGLFNPVAPQRICDTRFNQPGVATNQCNSNGAGATLSGNGTLDVQITGEGGIPQTGVSAVVLNLTATGTSTSGYLTAWPSGSPRPAASNVNWTAGQTVPNRVIAPVGQNGKISIYNLAGATDVVIDVNGWYGDGTEVPPSGTIFTGITPTRICDTRAAQPSVVANECNAGGAGSPLRAGQTMIVQVTTASGAVPASAKGVVINVTVTGTTAAGYLTVWPSDVSQRTISDLNWALGETVPNLVVVKLSATGKINVFNSTGSTDVIVDVVGYYT